MYVYQNIDQDSSVGTDTCAYVMTIRTDIFVIFVSGGVEGTFDLLIRGMFD